MLLEPCKTHPTGGVVIQTLMAVGGSLKLNKDVVGGLSVVPSKDDIASGKWDGKKWTDDKAFVDASELAIKNVFHPGTKEPGVRRFVPVVDRARDDMPGKMAQFDGMCRHVARGEYNLFFAQTFVDDAIESKLRPDEAEYLKKQFKAAIAKRAAYLPLRDLEQAAGGQGISPVELKVNRLENELIELREQFNDLNERLLDLLTQAKK